MNNLIIDKNQVSPGQESKRRSLIKSILWRVVGIVWTWIGAYFIMLLVPPTYKTAAVIATLIVVYHHSTRMVMYYFYERWWNSISWGKAGDTTPMKRRDVIIWAVGIVLSLLFIFFLILYVAPLLNEGK
jgi:uncharacterized membrane protein